MAKLKLWCPKCGRSKEIDPRDYLGRDIPEKDTKNTALVTVCKECQEKIKQN